MKAISIHFKMRLEYDALETYRILWDLFRPSLSWLEGGQEITQVSQSAQYNKVSMKNQNDAQADAFSLDYSSDK